MTPSMIVSNGLAVYARGEGPVTLLMPYPHGFPLCPMIEHPLADLLVRLGRRVVTFDPPGAFASTRPARVDLAEMLSCTSEALAVIGLDEAVDVVGQSMGGFCALAWTMKYPELVRSLSLIGAVSGGPSIRRNGGATLRLKWTDGDFWRFLFLGLRTAVGWGTMADHKRLQGLLWKHSYVDASFAPHNTITPDDGQLPAPVRDRWARTAIRLDLSPGLPKIAVPTLLCAGRFDPQAPVGCSKEMAAAIPGARLEIFERSGHYPYVEEPTRFESALASFIVL